MDRECLKGMLGKAFANERSAWDEAQGWRMSCEFGARWEDVKNEASDLVIGKSKMKHDPRATLQKGTKENFQSQRRLSLITVGERRAGC